VTKEVLATFFPQYYFTTESVHLLQNLTKQYALLLLREIVRNRNNNNTGSLCVVANDVKNVVNAIDEFYEFRSGTQTSSSVATGSVSRVSLRTLTSFNQMNDVFLLSNSQSNVNTTRRMASAPTEGCDSVHSFLVRES
jgi:hypothetical protein